MIRIKGTVEWVSMGAGGWEMVTIEGKRYTLLCEKDEFSQGEVVVIEGVEQASLGFMMRGQATIDVQKIIRK